MATAACGLQSTGNTTTKSHKERQKKAKDSGRRQAALLFLSNISLDGRPVCHITNGSIEQKDVADLHVRDVGAPAGPPPEGNQEYVVKVSPTAPAAGPAIGALSPGRPSLVMSPGLAASVAVANEVFLEGGSEDTMPLFLEAPLSPITPGHPSSARSPSVFSPVQGVSATHLDSRQRTRNVSGSPGPKAPKKVHFIRSMRQYDTRGSRIMLICAKRSLFAAFSVLPYGDSFELSDTKLEVQRQRLSSVVAADLIPSLEGMELGAYGKTVSYAQFLYPTNALVRPRSSGLPESFAAAPTPQSRFRGNGQRNLTAPARLNSSVAQEPCTEEMLEYDPSWLSDPQWPCGRHKRVLIFASYVTTVIEYVKPSDLKKDMNETFKEKFPHIKLTLSKIRSLKREIRAMGEEGSLQPVTIAMAFVYFEKLVLQGRLNKHNRKLVSAACVLLAAKISSDLRKPEVRQLLEKLEERFRINRRELIPLEFQVLVALEMGLYLPESKVMPHYRRLVKQG
ncbi:CDK5 and ABL1 enzyme substrate 2 isoform X1 [Gadus chalcogrammus]|uniref:CDK5 and ABL1 enzyme substrate 2 isoform X1 n=1 Tax=Gadus chalcogrammus TaxID=1042646 RepID=UPI0024C3BAC5|nr:CDK5 and ABL1 enzyme substrate 2 isoform X1 [Gadus chalcogrammus]